MYDSGCITKTYVFENKNQNILYWLCGGATIKESKPGGLYKFCIF